MKFYDKDGVEVDIKQFEKGSLVIARVTKPMDREQFKRMSSNPFLEDEFKRRGITLIWCPDWVEFKEWK